MLLKGKQRGPDHHVFLTTGMVATVLWLNSKSGNAAHLVQRTLGTLEILYLQEQNSGGLLRDKHDHSKQQTDESSQFVGWREDR